MGLHGEGLGTPCRAWWRLIAGYANNFKKPVDRQILLRCNMA
jgi:hypothetical protein